MRMASGGSLKPYEFLLPRHLVQNNTFFTSPYHPCAIRRPGECTNPRGLVRKNIIYFSTKGYPDMNLVILSPGCKISTIRRPGQTLNRSTMSTVHHDRLARVW